jgi:hypothetical protein
VEHSGRNKLPDGRRYDNNYCWVFRFQNGLIQEVREYMDTQLVTETFGEEAAPDRPVNAGNSRSLSDSVIHQLTCVLAG